MMRPWPFSAEKRATRTRVRGRVYGRLRLRRGIAFWLRGPMNEPIFFFVQETNDISGELEQLFRVLFDGCSAAKFHPLFTILHFGSSLHAFCVASRLPESTNRANVYFV